MIDARMMVLLDKANNLKERLEGARRKLRESPTWAVWKPNWQRVRQIQRELDAVEAQMRNRRVR